MPRKLPVPPDFILEQLSALYGAPAWLARMPPLEELIFTVLTQHTSDLNAERAYKEMRCRYPVWRDVMCAPVAELADSIKSGGLSNQKAPRIQAILNAIEERTGGLDISFLGEMPLEEAKAWLKALPGVGPKTAAVVLSFSLGMPAFPVDTHIHRVARRLRLITQKTSADDAHEILESILPPEQRYAMHVLLITHGRKTCKAPRPRCDVCPLPMRCPAGRDFVPTDKGAVHG